jgi:hypothetical protein
MNGSITTYDWRCNMSSHAKIARRWVEGGKHLKNRNLVMRGDLIDSYHQGYSIARIDREKNVAYVTTRGYSHSTRRHIAHVEDALRAARVNVIHLYNPADSLEANLATMHALYLGARLNSAVRWGRDRVWALRSTYTNYENLAAHMGESIVDESAYIKKVEDRRAEKVAKREENIAENIAKALHKWKHDAGEWQRRFTRSYVMVRLVRIVTHDPLLIQVSDQHPEKTKGWHHSSQAYIQTNNFGIEHLIAHDHDFTQVELDDITQEVNDYEQQQQQQQQQRLSQGA